MEIDKRDEVLIEEAILLNNKELYKEALVILLSIEAKYKRSSVINGLIASAFYAIKEYGISADYFKKTTKLKPSSELASLGLFHSLWELKEYKRAYKEMDRFLFSNVANNYKVTLKELYEQLNDQTPIYQKNIIETYYQKYFHSS